MQAREIVEIRTWDPLYRASTYEPISVERAKAPILFAVRLVDLDPFWHARLVSHDQVLAAITPREQEPERPPRAIWG